MTNKAPPGARKACALIPGGTYRHALSATITDTQAQLKCLRGGEAMRRFREQGGRDWASGNS